MIDAYFYTFSKRSNSTLKPSGEGYRVSVAFKETTDLEKPTLEIRDNSITSYNYCRIPDYSKYYRVVGRRSIAAGVWEIDLSEDYLATWISSIMGQPVYVAMSSVDFNQWLDDPRVSPSPLPNVDTEDCDFEIIETDANGNPTNHIISTVITDDGAFDGVDVIYAWDVGPDGNYIKNLATPSFFRDIRTNLGGGDPLDYVCEVWTTLLKPGACHTGVVKGVKIGDDDKAYEVAALTDLAPKRYEHTIMLPLPTNASDFRFSERFVKYYLVLPFIGIISIPTETVRRSSHLMTIAFGGEVLGGQFSITATIGNVNLGVYGTSLKAPLPLTKQSGSGASMVINGVGGAVSGAVTGAHFGGGWGAVGGALTGAGMGIAKAAIEGGSLEKTASSIGSISLGALFKSFNKPTVVMVEYGSDIDPATLTPIGRPAEKMTVVKNGYMQTRNASLSFAGTESELAAVNAAFDQGVFVE